jgi:tRNA(fMet)-specific endonuclease VapC
MGLILDSSVVIAAERRGDTVREFLAHIIAKTGDQDAALSTVGLAELVHGIYRAQTPQARDQRKAFIEELVVDVPVFPFTSEAAWLAGRLAGEQQSRGVNIPFGDLLVGATALSLGCSVLTINLRHFRAVPGLTVVEL